MQILESTFAVNSNTNMASYVVDYQDGSYGVILKDMDSGETVPYITKYWNKPEAKEKAYDLIKD